MRCSRRPQFPQVRPSRRIAPRRGLATLETVMSFPALIAVLAMLMAVGAAAVRKTATITQARHAAWSQREQRASDVLAKSTLADKQTQAEASNSLRLPGGLAGDGGTVSAVSKNQLLVGKWHDPFAQMSLDQGHFVPHHEAMKLMGRDGQLFSGSVFESHLDANLLDNTLLQNVGGGDLGGYQEGLGKITKSVDDKFKNSPITKKVIQPLTNQMMSTTTSFFSNVGAMNVNSGGFRSIAQAMNQVVLICTETLVIVANLFDPSDVIDSVIDKLPEPLQKIVRPLVNNSGGPLGSLVDFAIEASDMADQVGEAISKIPGVGDLAGALGIGGGGGESEEDKEKSQGNAIGKALRTAKRGMNQIEQLKRTFVQPMRNLGEAGLGRVEQVDVNSGDFSAFISNFTSLMESIEDVMETVETALDVVL